MIPECSPEIIAQRDEKKHGRDTDHSIKLNAETKWEKSGRSPINPGRKKTRIRVVIRSLIAMTKSDVKFPISKQHHFDRPSIFYGTHMYT